MLAHFAGLAVANNLARMQLLCKLGALTSIAVPRKAGGRPMMFCTVRRPKLRLRSTHNETANWHGFTRCTALTEARRNQFQRRLADTGGIDAVRSALSVIHRDK
jgi:hypothetical protein